MIISASRRTDIPAFHAEWFMQRLRDGYCETVNPFNPRQVSRVSLLPADVTAMVFWTRNAVPLLPHLPELDARGYRYYFQYTLTGYGPPLEPHCSPVHTAIATMRRLAEHVGPARVCWRYDPILLTDARPADWHLAHFAELAAALRGITERVTISLFDPYRAALKRLAAAGITPRPVENMAEWLTGLATTAAAHGMAIVSCAEADWGQFGIQPGKCIDDRLLRRLFGLEVATGKDTSQRAACGCVAGKDIGAYDTCDHGCLYCYATRKRS